MRELPQKLLVVTVNIRDATEQMTIGKGVDVPTLEGLTADIASTLTPAVQIIPISSTTFGRYS